MTLAVVERARVAVAVAFAVNGLAFASWAARTPSVRDALDLSPAQLGLLLLCLSVGAISALPLSGPVVHRLGPGVVVLGGGSFVTAGLLAVGGGVALASVPLAGVGLVLMGLGSGSWDVAMNVEGADVERRLERTLMPRFHAAFSLGTIAGAGAGAVCAALGISLTSQLAVTAAGVLASVVWAVRCFLPVAGTDHAASADGSARLRVLDAWREPRTVVVGLMVLAFAFTEGTANDWLALAFVDGHGTSEAVGALGFGAFVTAMTAVRLVGGSAIERWGRVAVLRATAATALVGLLLVVTADAVWLVAVGALLWGAGAALGFPVGMSAAADDEARAAVRVSVVSSVGYTAFLAGPPLIGLLAERTGVLQSLLVVVGALVVGLLAAGAARPLPAVPTAGAPTAGQATPSNDRIGSIAK